MTEANLLVDHHTEYFRVIPKAKLMELPSGTVVMHYDLTTRCCSGLYRWENTGSLGVVVGFRTMALKIERSNGWLPIEVPFRWRPYERVVTDADSFDFGTKVSYFLELLSATHLAVLDPEALKGLVGVASLEHLKLVEFDPFTMSESVYDTTHR